MGKKKGVDFTPLAPHLWGGSPVLYTARRLNDQSVALLAKVVDTEAHAINSPAVVALRERGGYLDDRVRERVGRCPVLLVDLNFQRFEWWESVAHSPPESMHLNGLHPIFTREVAAPLLHEILLEAWSIGRTLPRVVSLLFGMAPSVVQVIAKLSVQELRWIADEHARYLRPRWEDRRTFWHRLLQAAIDTDDDKLIDVQLHCLALLGSDLASRRANSLPRLITHV